jgi:hypothetical protein
MRMHRNELLDGLYDRRCIRLCGNHHCFQIYT